MLDNLLIALALAMDCFAVSVASGVVVHRFEGRIMLPMAFLFGFFQALMPLVGWLLTSRFSGALQAVDHWIAFGLLAFIGGKMIADSFRDDPSEAGIDPRLFRTQIVLAFATSIDALAVGITYACNGYGQLRELAAPLTLIGVVSFLMSLTGFSFGVRFGDSVTRKVRPALLGGLILIGIGIKILVQHLFL